MLSLSSSFIQSFEMKIFIITYNSISKTECINSCMQFCVSDVYDILNVICFVRLFCSGWRIVCTYYNENFISFITFSRGFRIYYIISLGTRKLRFLVQKLNQNINIYIIISDTPFYYFICILSYITYDVKENTTV